MLSFFLGPLMCLIEQVFSYPKRATQGGFGWFLDTGLTQGFHPGLKAHEHSYGISWCYFGVFQTFIGDWESSNIFSWLPNFL